MDETLSILTPCHSAMTKFIGCLFIVKAAGQWPSTFPLCLDTAFGYFIKESHFNFWPVLYGLVLNGSCWYFPFIKYNSPHPRHCIRAFGIYKDKLISFAFKELTIYNGNKIFSQITITQGGILKLSWKWYKQFSVGKFRKFRKGGRILIFLARSRKTS